MTQSVTYPQPLLTAETIEAHVLAFVRANPQGVRNADVGRAIGYNDSRQWFSYGILDKLSRQGLITKTELSLYVPVAAQAESRPFEKVQQLLSEVLG